MKSKVLSRISFAALTAACLTYCAAVTLAGGSVLRFGWYLVLTAVLIFLPGGALADFFVPELSGAGRFAVRYALGIALLYLNFVAAGCLGAPVYAMFAVPFVLSLWQLRRIFRAKKKPCFTVSPPAALIILAFSAALFVYAFSGVLAFAKTSAAGNMEYHQDMMWSIGNGAAVQFGFPLRDIRAEGGFLYYHYLADAVPGFLALAGNLLPYEASAFYNYPIVLFVLCLAVFAAAETYGAKKMWAAALPFAILFFNGFSSPATLDLLRNMNGVAAASALCCTLLYLLFWAERRSFPWSIKSAVAFMLCEGVLLLSKNLYGILIFCAIIAAVIVGGLVQRRFFKFPLLLAALSAGVFGLLWKFIFSHAINNLLFEQWISPLGVIKNLVFYLPLGFALYLISLVLSVAHFKTLSFGRLVVNAAALGGILAYFLFHHYSSSQVYFILAALLFIWFCALDALTLLENTKPLQQAAAVLCGVSLIGCAAGLLPVGQKGVQIALRCAGLRPDYPYTVSTVTVGDEQAALWLRENMQKDEIFAVNRNAKDPAAAEGTWHYYTAMSGRQAFVESWRYTIDYGYDYHALRHRLEQVSDVIFAAHDITAIYPLAQEYGIDYLLVSLPQQKAPFTGALPVFSTDTTQIYKIP